MDYCMVQRQIMQRQPNLQNIHNQLKIYKKQGGWVAETGAKLLD